MLRKLLVVDDNAINRQLLKSTLKNEYDIIEAENGKEALALVHKHYKMLSAILLDIVMPKMDGYELLKQIRDNPLLSQIPIIMITGSEDERSRVKALSLGANDFILKPFNPEIVRHCLKNNIALRETASILNAIQKDKLTGLFNREAFFDKVASLIAEHEPGYYILSCFDIDNFKLINDQYGASEGDRILQEIGRAVGKNAEEIGGVAGRISADNFAALFPVTEKETLTLQKILKKKFVYIEQQAISFSIGRYIVTDISLTSSALYDRAFIAKQSVKGRYDEHVAYFDDRMLKKLIQEQQIAGEMENALQEEQFNVWLQPQYNHENGELIGSEALVRWNHPQKGIIPPSEFIPLFEQNGFIYELDKFVWMKTCQYLRKWIDLEGDTKDEKGKRTVLPVSVNVSRYDVFRIDFIDTLTKMIEQYEIPTDLLRLEITESAFTNSSKVIVDIVKELISLGFTVEIDDFGSGYSSLNTLKNVPAQVIKLDMRFLEDGEDEQRGGSILESIVRMTKWLGMAVIAEGVEKKEQAEFLKSIGCTNIQGYLYSRPMPVFEFEQLLQKPETKRHFLVTEGEAIFGDAFWNPESIDSLIFNTYSAGACIFECHDGHIELIRVTEKYLREVFGLHISLSDAMRIEWGKYIEDKSKKAFWAAVEKSAETKCEATEEFLFVDLPGMEHETFLRSSLRVIASTDDRYLVFCTSTNITQQKHLESQNEEIIKKLNSIMQNTDC